MQNYEAQGEIVKGKQQSVRVYCGNLQNNTDVLRSNFAGTGFPTEAVVGQHCFREDLGTEFIYEADGWHECGDNNAVAKEVYSARGSHDSIKSRLDVALNEDGTLKAGAEINMNEWKGSLCTPNFVDENRFSTPNDTTAMFTKGRALLLKSDDENVVAYVAGADYREDDGITIVTISEANVPVGIKSVDVSIIQYAMPNTAVTEGELKEAVNSHNHADGKNARIPTAGLEDYAVTTNKIANNAVTGDKIADGTISAKKLAPTALGSAITSPETTGFTPHIASGMGIEIDGKTGKPVVTAGRCYVDGKYADLSEAEAVSEPNFRGLVYADKDDNDNIIIGTMPFDNPVNSQFIKDIPAEDLRFMTDYEIHEDDDKGAVGTDGSHAFLAHDLSGNGYNLTTRGYDKDISSPLGWKVLDPIKTWEGETNTFNFLDNAETFSVAHLFIPQALADQNDERYIFYIEKNEKKSGANLFVNKFVFSLDQYNPRSNTMKVTVKSPLFSVNTHDDEASTPAHYLNPCYIEANKPCLVVFEYDVQSYRLYVNGTLVAFSTITRSAQTLTAKALGLGVNGLPLFTCIRHGIWGEEEVATFANQIGIPNEHIGYDISLPTLYHGIETSESRYGYHAWDFDEEDGTTVYDVNSSNPIHGTLNLCSRVNTPVKEKPSVLLNGDGYISLGSYALPENFSFFTCITLTTNGTIASNRQSSEGFIFSVKAGKLSLNFPSTGETTDLGDVNYFIPVVVGFIKEGRHIRVFADTIGSHDFDIENSTALSAESPLTLGQYGAGKERIKAIFHKVLMANRAFSDSEIRSVFRSLKHRSYKKINDDMGLADKAVIGMIKTDENGALEQVETYPRWGRKKNPFGNQKYFLGWIMMEAGAGVYQIPNYYGSSRVRLNLYGQTRKGEGVIKTLPTEIPALDYKFNVSVSGTMKCGASGSSHTITSKGSPTISPTALTGGYLTCSYITLQAPYANSLIGKTNGTLLSTKSICTRAYIGFELEPIADEDNDNNYDF